MSRSLLLAGFGFGCALLASCSPTTLASRCGNGGSLHHDGCFGAGGGDSDRQATRRAALRDHQRLLDAIRDGNAERAERIARAHLTADRRQTLALESVKTIEANKISMQRSTP